MEQTLASIWCKGDGASEVAWAVEKPFINEMSRWSRLHTPRPGVFFVTPPSFQSRYLNYKLWQKLSNEYNTDQYHEESHESQDNRNFNLKQMIYWSGHSVFGRIMRDSFQGKYFHSLAGAEILWINWRHHLLPTLKLATPYSSTNPTINIIFPYFFHNLEQLAIVSCKHC